MKAAVYRRRGPAREVLAVEELPDPFPKAGEVRVRVAVSGVNPTDWRARMGRPGRDGPLEWAQVPDQDGAGTIDMVGDGVDPSRVGTRVWVFNAAHERPGGTAAEYTCVPEGQAVPLPDSASFDLGAGLGVPYVTAHRCLLADGPVAGATVLVTGGAGAVGNAAVQLARWQGARRVVATVSSDEKAALARAAGADTVLDYRADDHAEQLSEVTPHGIDRVVDVDVPANLGAYVDRLAQHAVVSSYASDPAPTMTFPIQQLRRQNVTMRFMLAYFLTPAMLDAALRDISAALADEALSPLPGPRFTLDEIVLAHEAVEQGAVGKVLVDVG